MPTSAKKLAYAAKLTDLLENSKSVFIISVDNVGSRQMQDIRIALRGKATVLMGKNVRSNIHMIPFPGAGRAARMCADCTARINAKLCASKRVACHPVCVSCRRVTSVCLVCLSLWCVLLFFWLPHTDHHPQGLQRLPGHPPQPPRGPAPSPRAPQRWFRVHQQRHQRGP